MHEWKKKVEKKGGKKGRLLLGLIIQAEKNDFNMKNQSKKRLWLHDQCVLVPSSRDEGFLG